MFGSILENGSCNKLMPFDGKPCISFLLDKIKFGLCFFLYFTATQLALQWLDHVHYLKKDVDLDLQHLRVALALHTARYFRHGSRQTLLTRVAL